MSLSDAAMVVLEADSLLFGGAHHDQYQNAFCARGILNGVLPGQGCWVTADAPQSDFGDWTLFPNPANDQIQVQIKGFSGGKTSFSIVDLLGRSLLVGQINTNQSSIDIGTLPAGTYIFRLSNAKGEMDARRIVIAR